MRTAVLLLVALAFAAVPGSLLPQRNVASDPAAVTRFYLDHPTLAPWLDRLWLFEVYSAPWFAAIYLLLLVSMTGCVLPRCRKLWHEFRAGPPAGPRRLEREAQHARADHAGHPDPEPLLDAAADWLRAAHYRVELGEADPADSAHATNLTNRANHTHREVRAERGRVRELGNLGFHLSLLVLLVGVAGGRLFGYEGRAAVVEGSTFTNAVASYDALTPAPLMDVASLEPLSFTLERFTAEFEATGGRAGEPRDFDARLAWETPSGSGVADVRPNVPLEVNGTKFFLTGHGYAPELTVRDATGTVVASGPTIFLPRDNVFTSDGVVKAPDASPAGIGIEAVLYPSAAPTGQGTVSIFPDLLNPQVEITAYRGDLGLDDGTAQSVFTLDADRMEVITDENGEPWTGSLRQGESVDLPGGGSVTFEGVTRFANFQIARDPGKEIALGAAVLLLTGLTVSLGVPRRRIWVRVTPTGVEAAARDLGRRSGGPDELDRLLAAVVAARQPPSPQRRATPTDVDPTGGDARG
jgi:cytochrome c biogenesis protein